ncbi:hypothetical protein ACFL4W_02100 [Planctomycetota bacterium]
MKVNIAIIIGILLAVSVVSADKIRVGPTQAVKTIAQAIEKARSGDVILLDAGRYTDSVTFNGELHFRSTSDKGDVIWAGVKAGQGAQVGALHLKKGTQGEFSFSGIQFTGHSGWIIATPKQEKPARIDVTFTNCVFEDSLGIATELREVILEECKSKKLTYGVTRCAEVEVTDTSFTQTGAVIARCKTVTMENCQIDTADDVVVEAETAEVTNLKIINSKGTIFKKIKEITGNELTLENGGVVGEDIAGSIDGLKVTNFAHGIVVAGERLVLSDAVFSNVKAVAINAKSKKLILDTVEIGFSKIAITDVSELTASDLTIKNCSRALTDIGIAEISEAIITDTDQVVFETIGKLTVEEAVIKNGGTLARNFAGSFEDLTVENFKQGFINNKGDLVINTGTLNKIADAGIDANGHALILSDITITACGAAIINAPDITASDLKVVGCGTKAIAAPKKSEKKP